MIQAFLIKKGFETIVGNTPEKFRRRVYGALGVTALAAGGAFGWGNAWAEGKVVKSEMSVAVGDQKVTDIDLKLSKMCDTGYTTTLSSMAKVATKVAGIEVAWKSQTVNFSANTELCIDTPTVKASLDKNKHEITVHINPSDITSDVAINPASVFRKPDMSPTQVVVENFMNMFRGTPFVQDVGFIKDTVKLDDSLDSFLANAAMTKGLKATANNCTPQVWGITHSAFEQGLANQILTGAKLYDTSLTPSSVKVLVGDAQTPADNVKQTIGHKSNIDKADASLQAILDKNKDAFTASEGTVGKCEISDDVRQAAQGGN